jgi:transcriptional regulator with XRE-family HTH domain
MKLKDEMRALRINRNFSLRMTAQLVGLSVAYISDMENGHRDVTPAILDKYLANGLVGKEKYSQLLLSASILNNKKMPEQIRAYLARNEDGVVAYIKEAGDSENEIQKEGEAVNG